MTTPEPERGADGARALEGERDVELVGADERARRAAEQDRLDVARAPPATPPARSSSSRRVVPNGTS